MYKANYVLKYSNSFNMDKMLIFLDFVLIKILLQCILNCTAPRLGSIFYSFHTCMLGTKGSLMCLFKMPLKYLSN